MGVQWPIAESASELVRVALELSDDEIDARLGAIKHTIDAGQLDQPSMYQMISVDEMRLRLPALPAWPELAELVTIGRSLRRRVLALLYEILCSGRAIWEGARDQIGQALGAAAAVLANAITVALIGAGIIAAIAALVAVALAKWLTAHAIALTCEWLARYINDLGAA
jgi:hypothetical protein